MGSVGIKGPEYVIEFSRRITILPDPIIDEELDKLRDSSSKWFTWIGLKMFQDSIDFRLKTTSLKVNGSTWKLTTFSDAIKAIKNIITLEIFEDDNPSSSIQFVSTDTGNGIKEPDSLHLAFKSVTGDVDLDKEPIPARPVGELGIKVHGEDESIRNERWDEQRKFRKYRETQPPEREMFKHKLEYGKLEMNLYPETIKFAGLDMEEESIVEFMRAFNASEPTSELSLVDENGAVTEIEGSNSFNVVMFEREMAIRGWSVNVTIDKFANPELPADIFIDKSEFLRSRVRENSLFIEITEFGAIVIKFYGSKRPAIKELLEERFSEPEYYFMLRADAGMVYGDLRIDLDEQLSPLIEDFQGIGLEVTFVKTHWHFQRDEWDWWRYPEVDMDRPQNTIPEDAPFNQTEEEKAIEIENKEKLDALRDVDNTDATGNRGWV